MRLREEQRAWLPVPILCASSLKDLIPATQAPCSVPWREALEMVPGFEI